MEEPDSKAFQFEELDTKAFQFVSCSSDAISEEPVQDADYVKNEGVLGDRLHVEIKEENVEIDIKQEPSSGVEDDTVKAEFTGSSTVPKEEELWEPEVKEENIDDDYFSDKKKIDNRRQTESQGSPDSKMSETDLIILDILGRDSPLVVGLPVKETWGTLPAEAVPSFVGQEVEKTGFHCRNVEDVDVPQEIIAENNIPSNSKKIKRCSQGFLEETEEQELKMKKMKLAIEIMEKESNLKTLEILKMEKELQLPPSEFTSHISNVSGYYMVSK